MLLYDYEEYESRHLTNPMNDGGNGGNMLLLIPLFREQFDHASKQLDELGYEHFLRCIRNTDDEQNDVQKWWAMFWEVLAYPQCCDLHHSSTKTLILHHHHCVY